MNIQSIKSAIQRLENATIKHDQGSISFVDLRNIVFETTGLIWVEVAPDENRASLLQHLCSFTVAERETILRVSEMAIQAEFLTEPANERCSAEDAAEWVTRRIGVVEKKLRESR